MSLPQLSRFRHSTCRNPSSRLGCRACQRIYIRKTYPSFSRGYVKNIMVIRKNVELAAWRAFGRMTFQQTDVIAFSLATTSTSTTNSRILYDSILCASQRIPSTFIVRLYLGAINIMIECACVRGA